MKKWILLGVIALLFIISGVVVLVIHEAAMAGKFVQNQYYKIAIDYSPVEEITSAEHYFGTEHLIVLYGKDKADEDMVVWMNEDASMIRHAWLKDAISKEDIAQKVLDAYTVDKQIKITPGMENDLFVWEAIYLTNNGQYLYAYYDFFTGILLRSIQLRN